MCRVTCVVQRVEGGSAMFDFSKLGDMASLADKAQRLQAQQDKRQAEQVDMLKKISRQLDEVLAILKKKQ